MADNTLVSPDFLTLTLGIVVYFVGVILNRRIAFLRNYNIPEPVTGGFLAAGAIGILHGLTGLQVIFEMATRDKLLVIFFATVGVNARLSDLRTGGRTLFVLAVLTAVFVFVQNIVGMAGAGLFGLPSSAGLIMGRYLSSADMARPSPGRRRSPTSTAFLRPSKWASRPRRWGSYWRVCWAGRWRSFSLRAASSTLCHKAPLSRSPPNPLPRRSIRPTSCRRCCWSNIAVILGYLVHGTMLHMGIKLPLFVPCLLMGIVLSNTVPLAFPSLT